MTRPLALHGWVWSRNYGDLLMLDLAKGWVLNAAEGGVTVPLANAEVAADLNLRIGRGVSDLLESRSLIIPGGGAFGMRPHGGLRQRVRMMRRFASPLGLQWLTRKPFSLVAIGAGPFGGGSDGRLIGALFDRAAFISVRDEESMHLLRKAGLKRSDAEVTADIVLSLTRADIPPAATIRARDLLMSLGNEPIIGIHLSGSPEDEDYEGVHAGVLQAAADHPYANFALIIDHPARDGVSSQQRAAAYLLSQLPGRSKVIEYSDHWTLAALLGELGGVITNKLHVAITSMALGNPAGAIAQHPKNHRLFRQLSLSDRCVDLHGVEAKTVRRLFNEIIESGAGSCDVPASVRSASLSNRMTIARLATLNV
ncbi:MAG: polysaccharide pyruvyl transferase family protein [Brevundimonas sp.]